VYDALTSVRPYKAAWPAERAFAELSAQAGRHFDPKLVSAFVGVKQRILQIQSEWSDPPLRR